MVGEIENCEICGKTSREVAIVNALLNDEMSTLCKICAQMEEAVVVAKPGREQLVEADRSHTVYERLVRISGVKPKKGGGKMKGEEEITLSSLQDEWLKRKEKLKAEEVGKIDKTGETKEIQKTNGGADINFRSRDLKIVDLKRLRENFFTKEASKGTEEEAEGTEKGEVPGAEELIE